MHSGSGDVAFRDVWCEMSYFNARGDVVERRYELIKDVFQPRELKSVELTGGLARIPFTTAEIRADPRRSAAGRFDRSGGVGASARRGGHRRRRRIRPRQN